MTAHARGTLLAEHVVPWAFAYLDKVVEIAPPFYGAWASLLRDALASELAAEPQASYPATMPDVPPVDGEDPELDRFLNSLLAFARSGTLLTRRDLRRAGAALGLAVRHGERRYILRALLTQDARTTLEWLSSEADRWAVRHQQLIGAPDWIRTLGSARARRASQVLVAAAMRIE